jgi:hypothetical protein
MTKWPLSEAMLNEMALEMALEAEQEADYLGKVCELTQMLMPTVIAMHRARGTTQQISVVLRLAMDVFQCRSEQEVEEKITDLRRSAG